MSSVLRSAGLAGALILGAFAVAASVPSQAADLPVWSAGQRASVTHPVGSGLEETIREQAHRYEDALGLAGASRLSVNAVDDLFQGRRVHEVTYLERTGTAIGLVRLDPDGRLLLAARLGYRPSLAVGGVDAERALGLARALARRLGVSPHNGLPVVTPTLDGTLWNVSWTRWVEHALVRGDGLTVRIWRNGELHSITLNERPLARVERSISAGQAREALDRLLPALISAERLGDAMFARPTRRWVAPNDQFAPAGPDAPARTLRLAWVFEARFGGASASSVRAIEVWIDAATGDLLGGDVLE